jgi:hypothetical protein
MKTISVILIAGLLTACAADPAKVEAVAEDEAARLQPPTRLLSTFNSFELQEMTLGESVQAEEGKIEEAREFEANLRSKIQPLLNKWNATEHVGGGSTLLIQPHLSQLKIVSGGARFWAGAFAGDSYIDMDLRLTDGSNGEEIADVIIRRDADSMTGAWSIGKSDQNLDDYIVTIVYEYLTDHY